MLTAYFTVPRDGEDPVAALTGIVPEQSDAQSSERPAGPPAEAAPAEPVDPWALEN